MRNKKFTDKDLKPSEVLGFAISDLLKARRTHGITVDMGPWFLSESGQACQVCMAGSVIAFSLGALKVVSKSGSGILGISKACNGKLDLSLEPRHFSKLVRKRLEAINNFRVGCIGGALGKLNAGTVSESAALREELGKNFLLPRCETNVSVVDYDLNPDKFIKQMRQIKSALQKVKL